MYSLYINAQSLNLTCTNLSYSLTGLPNSWQSQPFFTNLQAGQTYRVRIKDNCNGCVYEKDYTITEEDLIPRSECPCCSKLEAKVRSHPINVTAQDGSVTIHFKSNDCCQGPIRILSLPALQGPMRWSQATQDALPIEIDLPEPQYEAETTLDYVITDPFNRTETFVGNVVVQGCDCDDIVYVPIFFHVLP